MSQLALYVAVLPADLRWIQDNKSYRGPRMVPDVKVGRSGTI